METLVTSKWIQILVQKNVRILYRKNRIVLRTERIEKNHIWYQQLQNARLHLEASLYILIWATLLPERGEAEHQERKQNETYLYSLPACL